MVTGASGFVGRAVVRALKASGHRIVGVGTPRCRGDEGGMIWECVDLLDRPGMREMIARHRPETLIHAAWAHTRPGGLWDASDNGAWCDASMDLFESFWSEGGRAIAACGSCAEYARSDEPCREDVTPIAPTSFYGEAKARLAERALARADRLGMPFGWARLFYLFGPHEAPTRLVSSVIDRLLAGKAARTGQALIWRDFSMVYDIGQGLVALAEASARNGSASAYNLGSGEAVMLRDLICRIGLLIHSGELQIGALADRPDEAPRIVADMAKTHAATGWRTEISLDEGLERTIAWRLAHAFSNLEHSKI